MELLDLLDIEVTIGGKTTKIRTGRIDGLMHLKVESLDLPKGFYLALAEPVDYKANPDVAGFKAGLILDDLRLAQISKYAETLRVMVVPIGLSEETLIDISSKAEDAWR